MGNLDGLLDAAFIEHLESLQELGGYGSLQLQIVTSKNYGLISPSALPETAQSSSSVLVLFFAIP